LDRQGIVPEVKLSTRKRSLGSALAVKRFIRNCPLARAKLQELLLSESIPQDMFLDESLTSGTSYPKTQKLFFGRIKTSGTFPWRELNVRNCF
jgi:hypothetical protein